MAALQALHSQPAVVQITFFSRIKTQLDTHNDQIGVDIGHSHYIEVRDQVEMGGHTFWPFSLNYTFFKKIFHFECNP